MAVIHRLLDASPVSDLEDAIARHRAGSALRTAQRHDPREIIDDLTAAGVRGRGGAGFPTGTKWRAVAGAARSPVQIVVNAAEGEPGTFKDRLLLRSDPYSVLEGACIAAHAVGASEIVVALKASFERERARVVTAIDEFERAGWVRSGVIRVVDGPGEYLFGEDTALLEVIAGRPPFPRVVPSYRLGSSPDSGAPALVNNVETLADVTAVLRDGVDAFRSVGTSSSPGTILCTVTGSTARHGVAEFEMGTPLRTVIETIGSTVPPISVVLSGVSGPPITPDQLDLPVTYEDFARAGIGLGSASFIVVDADTSLHDVAAGVARFLAVESCGQCEPCKHDGAAIASELLHDGTDDRVGRLLRTVARGARCALAGQTERVVGSLLALAGPDDVASGTPYPILPLVDIVNGRAVLDETHLAKRLDWSYVGEEPDSHLDPRQRYADMPVVVRPTHRPEPSRSVGETVVVAPPTPEVELFGALHRSHDRIEGLLDRVRRADGLDRADAIHDLRCELELHRDALERFVFPLLEQLEPTIGPDVVWYPLHHEEAAVRLAERLDALDTSASARLVDELCADVHASIIEVDRRVLPMVASGLDDEHRRRLVDSDVSAVIEGQGSPT